MIYIQSKKKKKIAPFWSKRISKGRIRQRSFEAFRIQRLVGVLHWTKQKINGGISFAIIDSASYEGKGKISYLFVLYPVDTLVLFMMELFQ